MTRSPQELAQTADELERVASDLTHEPGYAELERAVNVMLAAAVQIRALAEAGERYREAGATMSASAEPVRFRQYDAAVRRQSRRNGRERGAWVYIPAEELQRAGFASDAPPPFYRTRGVQRSANGRSVIVSLYAER